MCVVSVDRSGVFIVEAEDTQVNAMSVLGLNSLGHGRLAFAVTPDGRGDGLTFLARDMLGAMGKDLFVSGAGRNGGNGWAAVRPWLEGESIREIIVLRASLLPAIGLTRLVDLAADVQARLWIVALQEAFSAPSRQVLSGVKPESVSWGEFSAMWVDEPIVDPQLLEYDMARFPRVPRDDFPTFRTSARRLLAPDAFTIVDEVYVGQVIHAREWFTSNSISEDSVASYLRAHALSGTVDEALTRFRAVQAALFLRGWYVKTELTQVIGRLQLTEQRPVTIDTVNRLRRYRDTSRASVGLLFSLTDRDLPEYAALTVSDVAQDGSSVRFASGLVEIPTIARPLLLAHRFARLEAGAQPNSPLYWTSTGQPWRIRRFTVVLRQLADETGLGIVPQHPSYEGLPPTQWARRYGFTVMRVAA